MKLRLTPLNIVSVALLVSTFYYYYIIEHNSYTRQGEWDILLMGIYGTLAIISIIADLVFRRLLTDIKRIWVIEVLFIILVVILLTLINLGLSNH